MFSVKGKVGPLPERILKPLQGSGLACRRVIWLWPGLCLSTAHHLPAEQVDNYRQY